MTQHADLALKLLTRATEQLEATHRGGKGLNFHSVRAVGEATKLFGFETLANRMEMILSTLTPEQFWFGAITNIERSNEVPPGAKQLATVDAIKNNHPLFSKEKIRKSIIENESHLLPCIEQEYEKAFELATSELQIEEVVLTQAILGDIDLAIDSMSRLTEHDRRSLVRFVLTIECYRQNQISKLELINPTIDLESLDPSAAPAFAFGIAGRVPWIGYPYPDY